MYRRITGGLLQSAGPTIAKGLLMGASEYVGSELMGWGLGQMGLGFEN